MEATMKRFKSFIYIALLLSVAACEDVIELDVPEGRTRLVVDGLLTDREELQTVKLKYTAPYFSNQSTPLVKGATVYVTDNTGEKIILEETAPGIYQKRFAGVIGRTYQLTVEVANGPVYRSLEEPLKAVPTIDSIYYEFEEASLYNEEEGYFVSITASDPPGKNDFYRWQYYVNGEKQSEPEDLFFDSDRLIDGNEGLTISFYRDALVVGDTALVEQMTISENAYEFLNLLYQQTVSGGSQFAPPPAPIKGNMVNVEDNQDYALGYFMVSAVKSEKIIIEDIKNNN